MSPRCDGMSATVVAKVAARRRWGAGNHLAHHSDIRSRSLHREGQASCDYESDGVQIDRLASRRYQLWEMLTVPRLSAVAAVIVARRIVVHRQMYVIASH